MARVLLSIIALAVALPAAAASLPICKYGEPTSGCVYDGDTFWLDHEKIRTLSCNAPEMGWPYCDKPATGAKAVRDRLTHFVKKHRVDPKVAPIEVFYPLHYTNWTHLTEPGRTIADITTPQTRYVHLWNELSKNTTAAPGSPLDEMIRTAEGRSG